MANQSLDLIWTHEFDFKVFANPLGSNVIAYNDHTDPTFDQPDLWGNYAFAQYMSGQGYKVTSQYAAPFNVSQRGIQIKLALAKAVDISGYTIYYTSTANAINVNGSQSQTLKGAADSNWTWLPTAAPLGTTFTHNENYSGLTSLILRWYCCGNTSGLGSCDSCGDFTVSKIVIFGIGGNPFLHHDGWCPCEMAYTTIDGEMR